MVLSLSALALLKTLPGAFAQGMIWGIMALGVYITYKILNFARFDSRRYAGHRWRCCRYVYYQRDSDSTGTDYFLPVRNACRSGNRLLAYHSWYS